MIEQLGIPTCTDPVDPQSLYMRRLFSSSFFGPFKDEEALVAALQHLDKVVPMWDDNPFCIIYGANPLPKDYVFGFKFVDDATQERIFSKRNKQ